MTDPGLQEEVYALLYNENKPEVAILRLNQILRKTPENSDALALRAYSLNRLANTRKQWDYSMIALASADKALTFNPFNDIALTSKGWALIDLGRADEAVPYLVSATKANPAQ